MPTFTAIAFDRFLEPEASKSVDTSRPSPRPPHPSNKLERRNSTSNAERKIKPPQISPALYATPEPTPLPDSPTSFSPSPYIINHKRRGPRLMKSFSEYEVFSRQKALEEEQVNDIAKHTEAKHNAVTFTIQEPIDGDNENSVDNNVTMTKQTQGAPSGSFAREQADVFAGENDTLMLASVDFARNSDTVDLVDQTESMSFSSNTEGEGNAGAESHMVQATPPFKFYDAREEFSSDSGPPSSLRDVEAELREIRISLLTEIDKRKQAEDILDSTERNWQKLKQQLAPAGLALPADLTSMTKMDLSDVTEEFRQQFYVARFVSDSIGRGVARAEMERELEEETESKNFEIARLCDRLHYYELVNREMSQRNQEAIEAARRERQRTKRRQKWVWGSIAVAVTVAAAAIAWSYSPSGNGSSSTTNSQALRHNDVARPFQ